MKLLSFFRPHFLAVCFCLLSAGCATPYLKGVTSQGQKVYLGPVPIENTEAFQQYLQSRHTEVDKQRYLFRRLKDATHLRYYHNGNWYTALEAYRGGMWLMRNKYQKGQNTRDFIRKYVERSEDTKQYYLVEYPDGSFHIGSYLLYNELDLLEETAEQNTSKTQTTP
jgi:hypothetical protein